MKKLCVAVLLLGCSPDLAPIAGPGPAPPIPPGPAPMAPSPPSPMVPAGPPPVVAIGPIQFTDVTKTAIEPLLDSSYRFDAAFVDFDNDGYEDLYIQAHVPMQPSRLWAQRRDGSHRFGFVDNATAHYYIDSPQVPRGTRDLTALDFDGDGQEDFSLLDSDVDAPLYHAGAPAGQMVPLFVRKTLLCGGADYCDFADINGDGVIDVIHDDRRITSALCEAGASCPALYPAAAPPLQRYGQRLIMDVNEDGWDDLVQPEEGGYWQNDRGTLIWQRADIRSGRGMRHHVAADFDNDGYLDLFTMDGSAEAPGQGGLIFRNRGDGTFVDRTAGSGLDRVVWTSYFTNYGNSIAADFDNDGLVDLLVAGTSYASPITILHNLGDFHFEIVDVDLLPSADEEGKARAAVADYDADGRLDIVKTQMGTNAGLWRNTTMTGGHFLRVRVRGAGHNAEGLGTCLRVHEPGTGALLGHYHVGASSQHVQKHPHVGLGGHGTVDLEVRFPAGGPRYVFQGLPADQEVVAYENGCLLSRWTPGNGWPLLPPPGCQDGKVVPFR